MIDPFYHCFLKPDQWTLHPWPFTPGCLSHKLISVGLLKASFKLPTVVRLGDRSEPSLPPWPLLTLNTATFFSHLSGPGHRAPCTLWFCLSLLYTPAFWNFHVDFNLGGHERFALEFWCLGPIPTLNVKVSLDDTPELLRNTPLSFPWLWPDCGLWEIHIV